ncbi:hypothetical protein D9M68_827330 [compost metagenome]
MKLAQVLKATFMDGWPIGALQVVKAPIALDQRASQGRVPAAVDQVFLALGAFDRVIARPHQQAVKVW